MKLSMISIKDTVNSKMLYFKVSSFVELLMIILFFISNIPTPSLFQPLGQEMLQHQLSSDDNISYNSYPSVPQPPRPPPPPNIKSPMKVRCILGFLLITGY